MDCSTVPQKVVPDAVWVAKSNSWLKALQHQMVLAWSSKGEIPEPSVKSEFWLHGLFNIATESCA